MNDCPFTALQKTLNRLNDAISKPSELGRLDRLGVTKSEMLAILKKLNDKPSLPSSLAIFERPGISHLGNKIVGYLVKECTTLNKGEDSYFFIFPAIRDMDRLLITIVFTAQSEQEFDRLFMLAREVLKNRSLFSPIVGKSFLENFPHDVNSILSGYSQDVGEWKMCPAFSMMNDVMDALYPHYKREWKYRQYPLKFIPEFVRDILDKIR